MNVLHIFNSYAAFYSYQINQNTFFALFNKLPSSSFPTFIKKYKTLHYGKINPFNLFYFFDKNDLSIRKTNYSWQLSLDVQNAMARRNIDAINRATYPIKITNLIPTINAPAYCNHSELILFSNNTFLIYDPDIYYIF